MSESIDIQDPSAEIYGTFLRKEQHIEPHLDNGEIVDEVNVSYTTFSMNRKVIFSFLTAGLILMVGYTSTNINSPSISSIRCYLSEITNYTYHSRENSSIDLNNLHTVHVDISENGRIHVEFGVQDDRESMAYGIFNDSLLACGWSQLWIRTHALKTHKRKKSYRNHHQVLFAAGYAEGALTHHRIDQHYKNTYESFFGNDEIAPPKIKSFLQANLNWIRDQVVFYHQNTHLNEAKYWMMVGSIIAQFDGLVAGYQAYSKEKHPISELDMYLLNADGDLEDLIPALNETRSREPGMRQYKPRGEMSYAEALKSLKCSALIRVLPGSQDVVWGHTTWDQYSAMNRIFKHYDIPIIGHKGEHKQRHISMSSSPGYISSVDDFYLLDSGLAIMETTNGIYNETLYKLIKPESILSWMRSKVSNCLGRDGQEWARVFSKYNSGTYNDQWMILDLHKFEKGHGFYEGGLTILEQMPGEVMIADVTKILNRQGYWASYNIPFFQEIYNKTGFAQVYLENHDSPDWTHEQSPRARIFRRDAPNVKNLNELKHIMRYNNWRNDPFSEGHSARAVAARYDLETDDTFSLDGGIDTKVTSIERAKQLECEAISGPTRENQPEFEWTEKYAKMMPHRGHPQVFNFSFVDMKHYDYLRT